jgi:hypothetical protein
MIRFKTSSVSSTSSKRLKSTVNHVKKKHLPIKISQIRLKNLSMKKLNHSERSLVTM